MEKIQKLYSKYDLRVFSTIHKYFMFSKNKTELCLVWQSTTVQMCCQDAVQTVQSGKAGKWACEKLGLGT
jgi:hypothetical protein